MKDTRPHFNNDYNHGMHPAILEAFARTNNEGYDGYGTDEWCVEGKAAIYNWINCPSADIHFLVGGTQVNTLMLEAILTRPYQSVLAPNTGHIHVHESGSIERTGHKIELIEPDNGKISAEQLEEIMSAYTANPLKEHITQPKCVYITFATEFGTVYNKKELAAIKAVCEKYNLYLYLDGARFGYGLASKLTDLTIADITKLTDAYTIGGTKCGALFGEALVISRDELKEGIRNYMKMSGALLAKGWTLGLQYYELFKDGLYFDICAKAVERAESLNEWLIDRGFVPFIESSTNQLFYAMENSAVEKLARDINIEVMDPIDETHTVVRICVAWSTTDEDIAKLKEAVERL